MNAIETLNKMFREAFAQLFTPQNLRDVMHNDKFKVLENQLIRSHNDFNEELWNRYLMGSVTRLEEESVQIWIDAAWENIDGVANTVARSLDTLLPRAQEQSTGVLPVDVFEALEPWFTLEQMSEEVDALGGWKIHFRDPVSQITLDQMQAVVDEMVKDIDDYVDWVTTGEYDTEEDGERTVGWTHVTLMYFKA